jgi:hypothetical protein
METRPDEGIPSATLKNGSKELEDDEGGPGCGNERGEQNWYL